MYVIKALMLKPHVLIDTECWIITNSHPGGCNRRLLTLKSVESIKHDIKIKKNSCVFLNISKVKQRIVFFSAVKTCLSVFLSCMCGLIHLFLSESQLSDSVSTRLGFIIHPQFNKYQQAAAKKNVRLVNNYHKTTIIRYVMVILALTKVFYIFGK